MLLLLSDKITLVSETPCCFGSVVSVGSRAACLSALGATVLLRENINFISSDLFLQVGIS